MTGKGGGGGLSLHYVSKPPFFFTFDFAVYNATQHAGDYTKTIETSSKVILLTQMYFCLFKSVSKYIEDTYVFS